MFKRLMGSRVARLVTVASVVAVVLATGSVFVALGDPAPATYYGCLKNGNLSSVDTSAPASCPNGATVISWNQQGPQGIQGPVGPQGPQGDVGSQGPQGIAGPQGPQGDVGPQGLQGPAGTSGVTGYEIVRADGASSSAFIQTVAAYCPSGKKVLGGGGTVTFDTGLSGEVDEGVAIHFSRPFTDGSAWDVQAVMTLSNTISTWHVSAFAICANAAP